MYLNINDSIAGRSKLLTLVEEIRRLIAIRCSYLQQVYAVKLGPMTTKTAFSVFTPASPWTGSEYLTHDGRRTTLVDGQRAGYMRLCLLLERSPQLILVEVLSQCESFRKDRAIVRYFSRGGEFWLNCRDVGVCMLCIAGPFFSTRQTAHA